MRLSAFTPAFLEDARKMVEKRLNYEYSWAARDYIRTDDPFQTVTEIVDFEDDTFYGGYCETCSYEETHCLVTYKMESGDIRKFEYSGSFAELISALVSDD